MIPRKFLFVTATAVAALAMQSSAHALLTECSAKYNAKAAGTLNSASWDDFRKSQCDAGAGSPPAKGSTLLPPPSSSPRIRFSPTASRFEIFERENRPRSAQDLPRSVQGEQSDQCQRRAEMAAEGGGYYSQCVKKLKGAA